MLKELNLITHGPCPPGAVHLRAVGAREVGRHLVHDVDDVREQLEEEEEEAAAAAAFKRGPQQLLRRALGRVPAARPRRGLIFETRASAAADVISWEVKRESEAASERGFHDDGLLRNGIKVRTMAQQDFYCLLVFRILCRRCLSLLAPAGFPLFRT